MEATMGPSEKSKKAERIANRHKKQNQKGISTYLDIDPHLTKCDYFEK